MPTSRGCWSLWPQLSHLHNGHVEGFLPAELRSQSPVDGLLLCELERAVHAEVPQMGQSPSPPPHRPRELPSLSPPPGGAGGLGRGCPRAVCGAARLAGLVGGCGAHRCLLGLVLNQTR